MKLSLRLSHLTVAAWLALPPASHSFSSQPLFSQRIYSSSYSYSSTSTTSVSSLLFEDFEDFEDSAAKSVSSSDSDLYAALRARQDSLQQRESDSSTSSSTRWQERKHNKNDDSNREESYADNWIEANCVSTVRLSLDDWVRRMSIHVYPLCVCGSSSGHLYLADLASGETLDSLRRVHATQVQEDSSPADTQQALEHLYGAFDGGGVLAIALQQDWVVSAGREGGVHLSTIEGTEEQVYKGSRGGKSKQTKLSLQRQGKIRSVEDVLITSLAFDQQGTIWMGGYDGVLRGYDYEERDVDGKPLMSRQEAPQYRVDLGSPIVNLAVQDEIGVGVASTLEKGVVVFSLEDGEVLGRWNPFATKVRKEFVRSAFLLKTDEDSKEWSLVVGGSVGSLFMRTLNMDRTGYVNERKPFVDQSSKKAHDYFYRESPVKLRPFHVGAVVAMASPSPGLLVTGSLDGSMRVWDTSMRNDDEDDELDDEDEGEEEAQYDDVGVRAANRPKCLYCMSGFKVWLGSIFANAKKLVSDGADNTIVVHSFDDDTEDALFREDEDEDMGGLSFE